MFEGVVTGLLNQYLGAFISGLDRQQLNVSLWSGHLVLTDLSLKSSALDTFRLPIDLVTGRIGKFTLDVNWRHLSSQPVRIELSGVRLIVRARSSFDVDADSEYIKALELKTANLTAVHEFRLATESEAATTSSTRTAYLSKLTETIVENIQIAIRDIVVLYETADGPLIVMALEELTVASTNELFQVAFVAVSTALSYKRIELRGLTVLVAATDIRDKTAGQIINDSAATYIIPPISGHVNAVISKDTSASLNPRIRLSSVLQSIKLTLSHRHYHLILSTLSLLSSAQQHMSIVLASVRSSSDRHLTVDDRLTYIRLYKATLNALWLNDPSDDDRRRLSQLESELSFADLSRLRTAAFDELKAELNGGTVMTREQAKEKAKSGGIMGGWFTASKQASATGVNHVELSAAQREEIWLKSGTLQLTATADTSDGVTAALSLRIEEIAFALVDNRSQQPLLLLSASGVSTDVTIKPQTFRAAAQLTEMKLVDERTEGTLYRQLIERHSESSSSPLIKIEYESHPPGSDADAALSLVMRAPRIILHAPLVAFVTSFFTVPPSVDLSVVTSWSSQQLNAIQQFSSQSLSEALAAHLSVDVSVDLSAPIFVIPNDPRSPQTDVLVVDLGQIIVSTNLQPKTAVRKLRDELDSKASSGGIDTTNYDSAYDTFAVRLHSTQLFLSGRGTQWESDEEKSYFIRPFDIQMQLRRCITQDINTLPNLTVNAELQQLTVQISDRSLNRIIALADTFHQNKYPPSAQPSRMQTPAAVTPPLHSQPPSSPSSLNSRPLDVNDLTVLLGSYAKARQLLAEVDLDGDGTVSRSEVDQWESNWALKRATNQLLSANIRIGAISIQIDKDNGDGSSTPTIALDINAVTAAVTQETFVSRVRLGIATLSVSDCLEPRPLKIIQTFAPENELSQQFIIVEYEMTDTKSPHFAERSVERSLNVIIGQLIINIQPMRIHRIASFTLNHLMPKTRATTDDERSRVSAVDVASPTAQSSAAISTSNSVRRRRPLREALTRLAVTARFSRFSVVLSADDATVMAEAEMTGFNADFTQYQNAVTVNVALTSIALTDRTALTSKYPQIIASEKVSGGDAPLVFFRVETHSPLDKDFPGRAATIIAKLTGLRINALNRFMTEMTLFALTGPIREIINDITNNDTATQRAPQTPNTITALATAKSSSSSPSPLSCDEFVSLDVRLEHIDFAVPLHSESDQLCSAFIQLITIRNERLLSPSPSVRLTVDLSAFDIHSDVRSNGAIIRRPMCELSVVTLNVDCRAPMNEYKVDVNASQVNLSLMPAQFHLINGILNYNLKEAPIVLAIPKIETTNAAGNQLVSPAPSSNVTASSVSDGGVSVVATLSVPSVQLDVSDDALSPLISLLLTDIGGRASLQANGEMDVAAHIAGLVGRDISTIGETYKGASVLDEYKQLLYITRAPPTSKAPFDVSMHRRWRDGVSMSTVNVEISRIRVTFGSVLIRVATLFSDGDVDGMNASLAPKRRRNSADLSQLIPARPRSQQPPSSVDVRIAVIDPLLQLIADPTAERSAATVLSWSVQANALSAYRNGRTSTQLDFALSKLTCFVTSNARSIQDAAIGQVIVAPFDVKMTADIRQTESEIAAASEIVADTDSDAAATDAVIPATVQSTSHRTVRVAVGSVAVRLSYSTYVLAVASLDALTYATTTADATTLHIDSEKAAPTDSLDVTEQDTPPTDTAQSSDDSSLLCAPFSADDLLFDIGALSLLVVNDTLRTQIPFARLLTSRMSIRVHSYLFTRSIRADVALAADSYNAYLAAWEPVIEEYSLTAALTSAIIRKQQNNDALVHYMTVATDKPLDINVTHAMYQGILDVQAMFKRAEAQRKSQAQSPTQLQSPSSPVTQRDTPALSEQTQSCRIENETELTIKVLRLSDRAKMKSEFRTSLAVSADGDDKGGTISVDSRSTFPFDFPADADPSNVSLMISFVGSKYEWPTLHVPFNRTRVIRHSMPTAGYARPTIDVVTEIFIFEGIKCCRIRSNVGIVNRTDVEFACADSKGRMADVILRARCIYWLPLIPADPNIKLRLRPTAHQSAAVADALGIVSGNSQSSSPYYFSAAFEFPSVLPNRARSISYEMICGTTNSATSVQPFFAVIHGQTVFNSGLSRVEDAFKLKTVGDDGRDDGDAAAILYAIRAPIEIENGLATEVSVRLVGNDHALKHQTLIHRGRSKSIFITPAGVFAQYQLPKEVVGISSDWSVPKLAVVNDKFVGAVTANVSVFDDEKRELVLCSENSAVESSHHIALFVPYWIFDLTALGLVFSADQRRTVPTGAYNEFAERMLSDDRRALMFNFPSSMLTSSSMRTAKDRTVRISTLKAITTAKSYDEVAWSKPLSLDVVGFRLFESVPGAKSTSTGKPQTLTEVGINIVQGSGLYRRTKMISIGPRFTIINQLTVDIECLQSDSTQPPFIVAAGGQSFLTWQHINKPKTLVFRRRGDLYIDWKWSGDIDPAAIGNVNLIVRNKRNPNKCWFARVESRMQDSAVYVIISAHSQSRRILSAVLPYRISNQCVLHTIRVRQINKADAGPLSEWLYIPPYTSVPYAWEQPLRGGYIEAEIGVMHNAGERQWEVSIKSIAFDDLGSLGKFTLSPIVGTENAASSDVFVSVDMAGATRVLNANLFPSIDSTLARLKSRTFRRRALIEQVRAERTNQIKDELKLIDSVAAHLSIRHNKGARKLGLLLDGHIQRPAEVLPERSAILLDIMSARALPNCDTFVSVEVEKRHAATKPARRSSDGAVQYNMHLVIPADNVSSTSQMTLTVWEKRQSADAMIGRAELNLFELDDLQCKDMTLPLTPAASFRTRTAMELSIRVQLVTPTPERLSAILDDIELTLRQCARVRSSLAFELREIDRGRLDRELFSGETEIALTVKVERIASLERIAAIVGSGGGRIECRIASELTGAESSVVVVSDDHDISQAILNAARRRTSNAAEDAASSIVIVISEDILAKRNETLHIRLFYHSQTADADSGGELIAFTSVGLERLSGEKGSANEWTNRSVALKSSRLPLSTANDRPLSAVITVRRSLPRDEATRALFRFALALPHIGISVISPAPEEILYFSLRGVTMTAEDSRAAHSLHLLLEHIQIDNQQAAAVYPVILAATYVEPSQRQPVLQISISHHKSEVAATADVNIAVFPYVSLLLQSIDIKVEEKLIYSITELITTFHSVSPSKNSDDEQINRRRISHVYRLSSSSGSELILFFQFLQIQPLSFIISFIATPGLRDDMTSLVINPMTLVLSVAGTALGSIESYPIRLNGRNLENVLGSAPVVVDSLRQYYQSEFLSQMYRVVGSLDFLGNPTNLVNTLGTGVTDFFYEPAKGIVESPEAFGRGLAKGSLSLLKNTVSGILGAFSKITASMTSGVALLSLDDNFIESTQNAQRKQPNNALTGLTSGFETLGRGLYKGVTGIVMDPVKGAASEGATGFFKGVVRGAAGVVAKPVAGFGSLVSSTVTGVANTFNDSEARTVHRIRPPRYIDRSVGILTPYNFEAAEQQFAVAEAKRQRARGG